MNKAKKVQVTCGIESVVVVVAVVTSVAFAVVVVVVDDDGDEDFSDSAENANQSFVE